MMRDQEPETLQKALEELREAGRELIHVTTREAMRHWRQLVVLYFIVVIVAGTIHFLTV